MAASGMMPPKNFESRPLMLTDDPAGTVWRRLNQSRFPDPLGYGHGPSRFSDPETGLVPPARFGVVYLGSSLKVCFLEAILRARVLSQTFPGPRRETAGAVLCCQNHELLGEGRSWIEGKPRLSFAHHVDHLDAENVACAVRRLEAEHGPETALDGAMILFDPVVQILTCPDPDGSAGAPITRSRRS